MPLKNLNLICRQIKALAFKLRNIYKLALVNLFWTFSTLSTGPRQWKLYFCSISLLMELLQSSESVTRNSIRSGHEAHLPVCQPVQSSVLSNLFFFSFQPYIFQIDWTVTKWGLTIKYGVRGENRQHIGNLFVSFPYWNRQLHSKCHYIWTGIFFAAVISTANHWLDLKAGCLLIRISKKETSFLSVSLYISLIKRHMPLNSVSRLQTRRKGRTGRPCIRVSSFYIN